MVEEVGVDDGMVKGIGGGQSHGPSALGPAEEQPEREPFSHPQVAEVVGIKLERKYTCRKVCTTTTASLSSGTCWVCVGLQIE